MNQHGEPGAIYGLGWAPIAVILFVQECEGYRLPNEDKELIRQRRVRGQEIDAEMGYVKKPHWWRLLHGEQNLSVQAALAKRAREVGGRLVGSMTAEQVAEERRREWEESGRGVELTDLNGGPRSRNADREVLAHPTPASRASARMEQRRQKELADAALHRAAQALFPSTGIRPDPERQKSDTEFLMSDAFEDARRNSRPGLSGAGSSNSGGGAEMSRTRSTLPSGLSVQTGEQVNASGDGASLGQRGRNSQQSLASTLDQPRQEVRSMLDI